MARTDGYPLTDVVAGGARSIYRRRMTRLEDIEHWIADHSRQSYRNGPRFEADAGRTGLRTGETNSRPAARRFIGRNATQGRPLGNLQRQARARHLFDTNVVLVRSWVPGGAFAGRHERPDWSGLAGRGCALVRMASTGRERRFSGVLAENLLLCSPVDHVSLSTSPMVRPCCPNLRSAIRGASTSTTLPMSRTRRRRTAPGEAISCAIPCTRGHASD